MKSHALSWRSREFPWTRPIKKRNFIRFCVFSTQVLTFLRIVCECVRNEAGCTLQHASVREGCHMLLHCETVSDEHVPDVGPRGVTPGILLPLRYAAHHRHQHPRTHVTQACYWSTAVHVHHYRHRKWWVRPMRWDCQVQIHSVLNKLNPYSFQNHKVILLMREEEN